MLHLRYIFRTPPFRHCSVVLTKSVTNSWTLSTHLCALSPHLVWSPSWHGGFHKPLLRFCGSTTNHSRGFVGTWEGWNLVNTGLAVGWQAPSGLMRDECWPLVDWGSPGRRDRANSLPARRCNCEKHASPHVAWLPWSLPGVNLPSNPPLGRSGRGNPLPVCHASCDISTAGPPPTSVPSIYPLNRLC